MFRVKKLKLKTFLLRFETTLWHQGKNNSLPDQNNETRWVEQYKAFEDIDALYLYIVLCLEIIIKNEDQTQYLGVVDY